MSSSKKSKLKQPEEALTTEETPIEVKVSPWPRRRRIVCHFFLCNAKSFGIGVLITFLSCLVYASIVYGSLVNRDIFRRSKNTIPGYHHPLQYNITLRFAANYHDAHNLSFSGQTQLLFEPTVLTPNFVMNIGPNVKINQVYFQGVPDGTFLRATKTGQDKKAQTISYVISFLFEPGRRYLAVIDYTGQLYPPANQRETPRLVLFKQNNKQSYAIVHINPSDYTEGLRFVTPSLDYDSFRARFALNIERHTGYSAISNMPIEQSIYQ
uniref:Peptidase_M1_N domain-containing protein n=1 Tax=Panagrellus redivivus TaxID=6233 RepID=A0A7E5A1X8_PANRE